MGGGGERALGLRESVKGRGREERWGRHISVLSHCHAAEQGSRELGGLFSSVC